MSLVESVNRKIKKKIIACFVLLTTIVSLFFIIDNYYSSKELVRTLELANAHEFLDNFDGNLKKSLSKEGTQYVRLPSGLEFGNLKLKNVYEGIQIEIHHDHGDDHGDEKNYISKIEGEYYIGIAHPDGSGEKVYIKKIKWYEAVVFDVLERSIITSSIVFWICLWVSIYIGVILAKFINNINKNRLIIAYTDKRTGLKNSEYLEQKADLMNKDLIFIDIIDLASFEEAFGVKTRDVILIGFSKNLKEMEKQGYVVGYYEYSRFYMYCERIRPTDIHKVVKNIVEQISLVIDANGIDFKPCLRVGVSSSESFGLLDKVITAVRYANKKTGNIAVYSEEMELEAKARVSYSAELSRAIENNEFIILYQPKVDLTTGAIIGVEGLVRWMHPQDGLLSPDKFIDLIPTSHVSSTFTLNILALVIDQIEQWKKDKIFFSVSVNVFPTDIVNDGFVSSVRALVADRPWLADTIEFELLESETAVIIDEISNSIHELQELGIECSIDDFGTGMSSLAYLKTIPVKTVKIDRSFIQDINISTSSEAIVRGLVHIAKDMNWLIIAEGVETQEISEKIKAIGIDIAQGYYYSRPVPAEDITEMFKPMLSSKYLEKFDKYKL
jgi:EAL domain-containing protein (putative c-di-GMP-specific phosphodiesterase class I)/GGDEF domain-containing protein